mmetsp:Transcript_105246/g.304456  ORF Transcript_105246/g.304456 Transcript_105246/m.304456 type:complete len:291 (+) Transcript_105246:219-1091(+)
MARRASEGVLRDGFCGRGVEELPARREREGVEHHGVHRVGRLEPPGADLDAAACERVLADEVRQPHPQHRGEGDARDVGHISVHLRATGVAAEHVATQIGVHDRAVDDLRGADDGEEAVLGRVVEEVREPPAGACPEVGELLARPDPRVVRRALLAKHRHGDGLRALQQRLGRDRREALVAAEGEGVPPVVKGDGVHGEWQHVAVFVLGAEVEEAAGVEALAVVNVGEPLGRQRYARRSPLRTLQGHAVLLGGPQQGGVKGELPSFPVVHDIGERLPFDQSDLSPKVDGA